MNSLAYLTLDKDVRQLRQSDIDAFAAQIRGGVESIDTSTQPFPIPCCIRAGDRQPAINLVDMERCK
jgi:hypothetical protein